MQRRLFLALGLTILLGGPLQGQASQPGGRGLSWRTQEIETGLKVGYAVLLEDVNGDGKRDIVVVDTTRVVWYENPAWQRRTLIEGKTKPDNVCIAAHDLDGDGKVEFVLGAGWKGINSKADGPLYVLRRGKTLDEPWSVHEIGGEPSVHRIRFADLDGDKKPELIVVPLLGTGSTKEKNWMDKPIRILAYKIPKDPFRERWVPEVLDESLHVAHNFWPVGGANPRDAVHEILVASYQGVNTLVRAQGKWLAHPRGAGNQANPKANRGASEIKSGSLKGTRFIATIEPWHGHQVVVYRPGPDPRQLWDRQVLDEQLKWGHAVWCADLDADGSEELIIGVRDDLSQKSGERRGVRIYKPRDAKGTHWDRQLVDEGGVAVEDLAAADLNGDGKIDIVAVGRQTGNVRIYWNTGAK